MAAPTATRIPPGKRVHSEHVELGSERVHSMTRNATANGTWGSPSDSQIPFRSVSTRERREPSEISDKLQTSARDDKSDNAERKRLRLKQSTNLGQISWRVIKVRTLTRREIPRALSFYGLRGARDLDSTPLHR